MSEIEQKVKTIVAKQLNIQDEIKSSNSFVDDLGADSLDVVELVMAFEEEFGIDIPDDKAESIKTVADAVKYIEENK
jgi:acyl carrier protein